MHPEDPERAARRRRQRTEGGTTEDPNRVSGRFLSDFFRALERQGLPASEILGDLPVALGEDGDVTEPVEWDHFVELMRRLGRALGGPAEVERCGATLAELKPARAIGGLAGIAASPLSLYRAASGWALRRALPGIETRLSRAEDGQLEIHARIADGLRPCPEIFHFATGGARILPRLIGLDDAVVVADVGLREAHYRIAVPPSRTLFSRLDRIFKTILSAGDVLRFLETQQLELHAKNEALLRANAALAASEQRYRAIAEAAVDVSGELDEDGRVTYVNASIERLIGYSPAQVTGSHYRLWLPTEAHAAADEVFEALLALPAGRARQERILLHGAGGERVFAELTARSYDDGDGRRRIVCIVHDPKDDAPIAEARSDVTAIGSDDPTTRTLEPADEPATLAEVVERALGEDSPLALESEGEDATRLDGQEEKDERPPEASAPR